METLTAKTKTAETQNIIKSDFSRCSYKKREKPSKFKGTMLGFTVGSFFQLTTVFWSLAGSGSVVLLSNAGAEVDVCADSVFLVSVSSV